MLIPNRFSNLKFSIINITALLIEYIVRENEATVDELINHLQFYSKDFERDDVLLSVTFLFALGKVRYIESKDIVELVPRVESCEILDA